MSEQKTLSPILVSKRDAATALGISVRSVDNYLAAKKLVARKLGRRRLITVASLRALASHDSPSPSPTARGNSALERTQ